jgi:uncharacterized membrane protein YgcG
MYTAQKDRACRCTRVISAHPTAACVCAPPRALSLSCGVQHRLQAAVSPSSPQPATTPHPSAAVAHHRQALPSAARQRQPLPLAVPPLLLSVALVGRLLQAAVVSLVQPQGSVALYTTLFTTCGSMDSVDAPPGLTGRARCAQGSTFGGGGVTFGGGAFGGGAPAPAPAFGGGGHSQMRG